MTIFKYFFFILYSFDAFSQIDTFLGESYEEGSSIKDNEYIEQLAKMSVDFLKLKYPEDAKVKVQVPRDVHAKSHGCLFGHLVTNNQSLPIGQRVGIFKNNSKYKIVLRYSSNDKKREYKDNENDIRGLGLKVMNVNNQPGLSQDFLFLGKEVFFIKDNSTYVTFLNYLLNGRETEATMYLAYKDLKGALLMLQDRIKIALNYKNPVDIPFFSAVPYRLGGDNFERKAVKYKVTETACGAQTTEEINLEKILRKKETQISMANNNPNYLRKNLKLLMNRSHICFNLDVQIRNTQDKDKYPVEDASIPWDIPYVNVGKILLPAQSFDYDEMNTYCENLKFTPWNTIPEHLPLGRTNRARKRIYEAVSDYRHKRNQVEEYAEPKDFSLNLKKLD